MYCHSLCLACSNPRAFEELDQEERSRVMRSTRLCIPSGTTGSAQYCKIAPHSPLSQALVWHRSIPNFGSYDRLCAATIGVPSYPSPVSSTIRWYTRGTRKPKEKKKFGFFSSKQTTTKRDTTN